MMRFTRLLTTLVVLSLGLHGLPPAAVQVHSSRLRPSSIAITQQALEPLLIWSTASKAPIGPRVKESVSSLQPSRAKRVTDWSDTHLQAKWLWPLRQAFERLAVEWLAPWDERHWFTFGVQNQRSFFATAAHPFVRINGRWEDRALQLATIRDSQRFVLEAAYEAIWSAAQKSPKWISGFVAFWVHRRWAGQLRKVGLAVPAMPTSSSGNPIPLLLKMLDENNFQAGCEAIAALLTSPKKLEPLTWGSIARFYSHFSEGKSVDERAEVLTQIKSRIGITKNKISLQKLLASAEIDLLLGSLCKEASQSELAIKWLNNALQFLARVDENKSRVDSDLERGIIQSENLHGKLNGESWDAPSGRKQINQELDIRFLRRIAETKWNAYKELAPLIEELALAMATRGELEEASVYYSAAFLAAEAFGEVKPDAILDVLFSLIQLKRMLSFLAPTEAQFAQNESEIQQYLDQATQVAGDTEGQELSRLVESYRALYRGDLDAYLGLFSSARINYEKAKELAKHADFSDSHIPKSSNRRLVRVYSHLGLFELANEAFGKFVIPPIADAVGSIGELSLRMREMMSRPKEQRSLENIHVFWNSASKWIKDEHITSQITLVGGLKDLEDAYIILGVWTGHIKEAAHYFPRLLARRTAWDALAVFEMAFQDRESSEKELFISELTSSKNVTIQFFADFLKNPQRYSRTSSIAEAMSRAHQAFKNQKWREVQSLLWPIAFSPWIMTANDVINWPVLLSGALFSHPLIKLSFEQRIQLLDEWKNVLDPWRGNDVHEPSVWLAEAMLNRLRLDEAVQESNWGVAEECYRAARNNALSCEKRRFKNTNPDVEKEIGLLYKAIANQGARVLYRQWEETRDPAFLLRHVERLESDIQAFEMYATYDIDFDEHLRAQLVVALIELVPFVPVEQRTTILGKARQQLGRATDKSKGSRNMLLAHAAVALAEKRWRDALALYVRLRTIVEEKDDDISRGRAEAWLGLFLEEKIDTQLQGARHWFNQLQKFEIEEIDLGLRIFSQQGDLPAISEFGITLRQLELKLPNGYRREFGLLTRQVVNADTRLSNWDRTVEGLQSLIRVGEFIQQDATTIVSSDLPQAAYAQLAVLLIALPNDQITARNQVRQWVENALTHVQKINCLKAFQEPFQGNLEADWRFKWEQMSTPQAAKTQLESYFNGFDGLPGFLKVMLLADWLLASATHADVVATPRVPLAVLKQILLVVQNVGPISNEVISVICRGLDTLSGLKPFTPKAKEVEFRKALADVRLSIDSQVRLWAIESAFSELEQILIVLERFPSEEGFNALSDSFRDGVLNLGNKFQDVQKTHAPLIRAETTFQQREKDIRNRLTVLEALIQEARDLEVALARAQQAMRDILEKTRREQEQRWKPLLDTTFSGYPLDDPFRRQILDALVDKASTQALPEWMLGDGIEKANAALRQVLGADSPFSEQLWMRLPRMRMLGIQSYERYRLWIQQLENKTNLSPLKPTFDSWIEGNDDIWRGMEREVAKPLLDALRGQIIDTSLWKSAEVNKPSDLCRNAMGEILKNHSLSEKGIQHAHPATSTYLKGLSFPYSLQLIGSAQRLRLEIILVHHPYTPSNGGPIILQDGETGKWLVFVEAMSFGLSTGKKEMLAQMSHALDLTVRRIYLLTMGFSDETARSLAKSHQENGFDYNHYVKLPNPSGSHGESIKAYANLPTVSNGSDALDVASIMLAPKLFWVLIKKMLVYYETFLRDNKVDASLLPGRVDHAQANFEVLRAHVGRLNEKPISEKPVSSSHAFWLSILDSLRENAFNFSANEIHKAVVVVQRLEAWVDANSKAPLLGKVMEALSIIKKPFQAASTAAERLPEVEALLWLSRVGEIYKDLYSASLGTEEESNVQEAMQKLLHFGQNLGLQMDPANLSNASSFDIGFLLRAFVPEDYARLRERAQKVRSAA